MSLILPALAALVTLGRSMKPLNKTAKWLQHEIQDTLDARPCRRCTLEEIREEDRLYTDYLVAPDGEAEEAFYAYTSSIRNGRCIRETAQGPLVNQLCYRGQWGNCLIQQTPITVTVASNFEQQTEGFLYDLEHCPIYSITVPTGAVLDSIDITLHFMGNGQTGSELNIKYPIMIANVMGNAVGAFSFALFDDYHSAVSFDTGNPKGNREENSLITIAKPPILPTGRAGFGRTSLSTGTAALSHTEREALLSNLNRWTPDDVFEVNEHLTGPLGSEGRNDLTVTAVPMGSNFTMQVRSFQWDSHCRVVNLEGYLDWSVDNNGTARQSIMIVQTQGTKVERSKRNIVACIYPWLATNLNLLEASVALTISGGNYGQLMLYATRENPERINVREYASILPFSITTNYLHPCNAWPDLNIVDYTGLKERIARGRPVLATDILVGLGIPRVSDWRRLSKNYTVRRDANTEYARLGETTYRSKCGQELDLAESEWSTDCTMLWECNEIVEGPCTTTQLTTNVSQLTTYPTTMTRSALTNIGSTINSQLWGTSLSASNFNITNIAMEQPDNDLDMVSILRRDPGYRAFFSGLKGREMDSDDIEFLRMSTFNTARHRLVGNSLADDPSPNYLGLMVDGSQTGSASDAEVTANLLTQLVENRDEKGEVNFHVVGCTPARCPTMGLSIAFRRRRARVTLANTGTNTVNYLGLADMSLNREGNNLGLWSATSEIFASSIEASGAVTNSTMSTNRYVRS